MEYLKIALSALFSLVTLFFLTKLMGCRQMSQLSMFDYINGISIGSIAAEFATSEGREMLKALVAMIIYAFFTLALSFLTDKSVKLRGFVAGKPYTLLKSGKFYRNNFKKCKLDINEFVVQCRVNGYFNLSDIDTAIFESNGRISFLPQTSKSPATPTSMNISIEQELIPINVIEDGKILEDNLKSIGFDLNWLKSTLKGTSEKDVFIAMADKNGVLWIGKTE
ncbi:MAG: DUF421 domain-containing protein [Clostridia bacterium]